LQDILLSGLLELGGPELLAAAHDEAARHVEEHHRWDGAATSPRSGCPRTTIRVKLAMAASHECPCGQLQDPSSDGQGVTGRSSGEQ